MAKHIFLLGNSGVGKTTFFQHLSSFNRLKMKTLINPTFISDDTQDLNSISFNELNYHQQQLTTIGSYIGKQLIIHHSLKEIDTISDEHILSCLIWSRALLLMKKITFDEYIQHRNLVWDLMDNMDCKNDYLIILKKPRSRILNNITERNRDIEILGSSFKDVYSFYVEIYYDELEIVINSLPKNVQDQLNIVVIEEKKLENVVGDFLTTNKYI